MEDLARLGLVIESGQVRSAVNDLAKLQSQSASVERQVDKTTSSFTVLNRAAGVLSTTLAAVATSVVINQLTKYADTATKIENSIRTVTSSTAELVRVNDQLFAVAQRSRSGFEATSDLYTKLSKSTTELNISQTRLLRITETINKSFAASGADAASADSAIRQLGQGLASGALRGDEFNSVAENSPEILRAVAQETQKTVGELREFAATGGITAELLIRSLENYADTVDRVFDKSTATLQQYRTVADNNFIREVQQSKTIREATTAYGKTLVFLSENVDEFAQAAEGAATIVGVYLLGAVVKTTVATAQKIAVDINAAKAAKALAIAEAEKAVATTTAATASAEAAVKDAAANASRLRSTITALEAEMALERQRLAAQISEQGRIATSTRMAEIGVARAAITTQLANAEKNLAASTTVAIAATEAQALATTQLNAAQSRTLITTGLLSRAVGFLTGPWGLLLTTVAGAAAIFLSARDASKETAESLDKDAEIVSKYAAQYERMSKAALAQTAAQAQLRASNLQAQEQEIRNQILIERGNFGPGNRKAELNKQLEENIKAQKEANLEVEAANQVFEQGLPKVEAYTNATAKVKVEVNEADKAFKSQAESIALQIAELTMSAEAYEKYAARVKLGSTATVEQITQTDALVARLQKLRAEKEAADKEAKQVTKYRTEFSALDLEIRATDNPAEQARQEYEERRTVIQNYLTTENADKEKARQVDLLNAQNYLAQLKEIEREQAGPNFFSAIKDSLSGLQNQATGTLAQMALGLGENQDLVRQLGLSIVTQLTGAMINYGIEQAIAYATGATAAATAEATKTAAVVASLSTQTAAATAAQATVTTAAVASGTAITASMAPAAAASSVATAGAAPAAAAPIALGTIAAIIAAIVGGVALFGRAQGGQVRPGSTYTFAERGPELFTPSSYGKVTPFNQLMQEARNGSKGSVSKEVMVNFTVNAMDTNGFENWFTNNQDIVVNTVRRALAEEGRDL